MTARNEKPSAIRILKSFSKREYAEQFLDGELYMNTLFYFRWNGTEDQRDALEGASGFVLPESMQALPKAVRDAQAHKTAILPAGLSYANVCCFFMQTAHRGTSATCIRSPHDPSKLGGYYVAIDDFQAFIDKIDLATKVHGLHYYCAPVSYWEIEPAPGRIRNTHSILMLNDEPLDAATIFPDGVPEFPHDMFYKHKRYARQMEWRIALSRGVQDVEAYTLRIGSLREIAHMVVPDELDTDTRLCAGISSAWVSNPEGGNITRRGFFDELCALEPNRFYVGLSIG